MQVLLKLAHSLISRIQVERFVVETFPDVEHVIVAVAKIFQVADIFVISEAVDSKSPSPAHLESP